MACGYFLRRSIPRFICAAAVPTGHMFLVVRQGCNEQFVRVYWERWLPAGQRSRPRCLLAPVRSLASTRRLEAGAPSRRQLCRVRLTGYWVHMALRCSCAAMFLGLRKLDQKAHGFSRGLNGRPLERVRCSALYSRIVSFATAPVVPQ